MYGGRAVSEAKLRELERAADGAEARLRRARDAHGDAGSESETGTAG